MRRRRWRSSRPALWVKVRAEVAGYQMTEGCEKGCEIGVP
jgi:hypothetical protein